MSFRIPVPSPAGIWVWGALVLDCIWDTDSEICAAFSELVLVSAGSRWSRLLSNLCWTISLLPSVFPMFAAADGGFSNSCLVPRLFSLMVLGSPSLSSHWLCGIL